VKKLDVGILWIISLSKSQEFIKSISPYLNQVFKILKVVSPFQVLSLCNYELLEFVNQEASVVGSQWNHLQNAFTSYKNFLLNSEIQFSQFIFKHQQITGQSFWLCSNHFPK